MEDIFIYSFFFTHVFFPCVNILPYLAIYIYIYLNVYISSCMCVYLVVYMYSLWLRISLIKYTQIQLKLISPFLCQTKNVEQPFA